MANHCSSCGQLLEQPERSRRASASRDRRHGRKWPRRLIHTLDAYLSHGCDARKTAEALHLHRSTLYYRLERITEAVGGDLRDGETRFELMLSIRLANIARLHHN